jgi:hypothetical protein
MTDQEDRPFSDEEAALLRRQPELPRELEGRVVRALSRPAEAGRDEQSGPATAGHYKPNPVVSGFSRTRLVAIAASTLLAFAIGRWTAPAPSTDAGGFLLLIQDAPGDARLSPAESSKRVGEFVAWARDLRARGALTSAAKLENGGTVISADSTGPLTDADLAIGGFFVVRASTPEEAASIARGAPHLKNGGRVVLRRFE